MSLLDLLIPFSKRHRERLKELEHKEYVLASLIDMMNDMNDMPEVETNLRLVLKENDVDQSAGTNHAGKALSRRLVRK